MGNHCVKNIRTHLLADGNDWLDKGMQMPQELGYVANTSGLVATKFQAEIATRELHQAC